MRSEVECSTGCGHEASGDSFQPITEVRRWASAMDEVDGMASKKETDEILGLGLRTDVTWIVVTA